uniref:Uncharacterized protein n=1 Tax=Kalanchoe fedtschenkoi TaxID=63787 RepID=A0A7N0ZZV0_KALFE
MRRAARRIEDEFEETLSLIDMPITPMRQLQQQQVQPGSDHQLKQSGFTFTDVEEENRVCSEKQEVPEFDFGSGSGSGSPSTRMEMSSADELFLDGQILPLRLSVDSKMARVIVPGTRPDSASECRSSSIEFTSSRSSSYSSTSSVNNAAKTRPFCTSRTGDRFHAHPSPTPQIRGNPKSSTRCRKSSVWDIFRLGPRIDLKNIKCRNPISNSNRSPPAHGFSFTSKSGVPWGEISSGKATLKQRMFGLGGCRCAADAVEDVQRWRIVVVRSGAEMRRRSDFKEEELEGKLAAATRKQGMAEEEAFPSRRTFEWLKQFSVGGGNVN